MKKIRKIIGILLVLCGVGIYACPSVNTWLLNQQTKQYIREFQEKYDQGKPASKEKKAAAQGDWEQETAIPDQEPSGFSSFREDSLYQEIQAYNAGIYESGQAGFRDAWSYQQSPVSLEGLEDGKYGYLQIPAMDLTLPIYIGASDSNMAKGAVILGQTSIPIGGKNTNSVIAGHRGWKTGDFFLDIETLSPGDWVYLTNPWQTLSYQVESIDIILPDNIDAVKIQEGRDMITLVTCHPYMSAGKYRYLVYCVRNEEGVMENEKSGSSQKQNPDEGSLPGPETGITASDGTVYESSKNAIRQEDMLRKVSALAMILLVGFSFVYTKLRDRKK